MPNKPFKKPTMIGLPPSARGGRPADIAAHASQVAQEEELRAGGNHVEALKAAAKTQLQIMAESRRLCKAMAR
jgi:hypothetical protein